MIKISEIKKFQKGVDNDDFFTSRIYRKLSVFLSWIFINLGASANTVTFTGFILDLITVYMVFTNHWIIAGILVQLFIVWDCVDGEVARYRRSVNPNAPVKKYGEFIDDMLGLMGFYFIVLLIGMKTNFIAGVFASYALLLLNFSSALTSGIFDKRKLAQEVQSSLSKKFGLNIRGRLGFTADIQRTLISLALFFSTQIFLWIYFAGAMALILVKFWVYRNK